MSGAVWGVHGPRFLRIPQLLGSIVQAECCRLNDGKEY